MNVSANAKKLFTLLDLCVSSLRRGQANLLCIVPILTDDPRRKSENQPHECVNKREKNVYTSRFVRVILAQGTC